MDIVPFTLQSLAKIPTSPCVGDVGDVMGTPRLAVGYCRCVDERDGTAIYRAARLIRFANDGYVRIQYLSDNESEVVWAKKFRVLNSFHAMTVEVMAMTAQGVIGEE